MNSDPCLCSASAEGGGLQTWRFMVGKLIDRPWFEAIAERIAKAAGHPIAFVCCGLLILFWGASGPVFHFSDTWQLVINTGTTIVTFLMVFLLQNSQNRGDAALHVKLDEIIRSTAASNTMIGLQEKTDAEIKQAAEEIKAAVEENGIKP